MKLKARGIFVLVCCAIIGVMLLIDYQIRSGKHYDDLIKSREDFQNAAANGGHLHVLRKDLDESNYKSDSLKSENLKSRNKENSQDKDLEQGDVSDKFEDDVMKTIREAIHHSPVLKKKVCNFFNS